MMLNRLIIGLAISVAGVAGNENAGGDSRPDYMGVFKTSSFMALEWGVGDTSFVGYNAQELFDIESGASKYFNELLSDKALSAFQRPNEFVEASVVVRRQILTGQNMILETTLNVYHIGDSGIADLSDLLRFVTNKNTTGSGDFLVLDSLIGFNVGVDMVSFVNAKESEALAGGFDPYYLQFKEKTDGEGYTESEKTLIVVVSVLSFAVLALSFILIWIAGGWLILRRQVQILLHREEELTRMTQGLEQKPTRDTEDDNSPQKEDESNFTNPSGILGVNPYYGKSTNTFEGLGVKMTPGRPKDAELDSEIGTPMSEYSDSGRIPIGITSMRKLLANRESQENVAPNNPYGIKRLQYDD